MPTPRIYQNMLLQEKNTVEISMAASHYIAHVRRLREGDPLIVFNGQGDEFTGILVDQNKHKLVIQLENRLSITPESPLKITLVQGIARGDKMDLIIQKAIELGVQSIIPIFTERCTIKLDPKKRETRQQHWQAIAMGACEQSGRHFVPDIELPRPLSEWLKGFNGMGILLSPHAKTAVSNLKLPSDKNITLVVGPEGGLSPAEIELFPQALFVSVRLGPRVLRTETAPIAAVSILQALFGDMG